MNDFIDLMNLFPNLGNAKRSAVLLAHNLIGTVRSKSANGLMMHGRLFDIVGIADCNAIGCDTSKVCPGVSSLVTVYKSVEEVLKKQKAEFLILLIPPTQENYSDIEYAIKSGLKIINTSFDFIRDNTHLMSLIKDYSTDFLDIRDVAFHRAYPNPENINRKAKVVFVTGTDCGLGKRTAAYELISEAKSRGINAAMYATGQTGLMLGEKGTVVDALIIEYSNGVVSQHVTRLSQLGYDLIFVEGQSDIYHPANSAVSLALLHGSNPDCIVLVHDEHRLTHKGFVENSPLYSMHPFQKHIEVLEMLSLPCGPKYETVAIATIGEDNITEVKKLTTLPVADVRKPGGPAIILDAVLKHLKETYNWKPKVKESISN